MGIRSKLLILVSGLVALTFLGVAIGVTEMHRRERFEEFRDRRALLLSAVGATAGAYAARNDPSGLATLVRRIGDEEGDLREVAVLDGQGRILAHSDPARLGSVSRDAFSELAVRSAETTWRREGDQLRISVPMLLGQERGAVTATYSTQRISAAITRIGVTLLSVAAAMGVVLSSILLAGLYRLVLRPVRTLQSVARAIGEGSLDARVPALAGGELGELGDSFNQLAAALKAQKESLEHVVAERTRELREANIRLETLAVTDGLTGVFNHRRFQEAIEQETVRSARTGRAFSLLFLDVDHFKRFNDSMGHPAGDELLRQLAALLRRELRSSDLVARHGGEEFAVLLAETDKSVALEVAERLRAAVELELNDTAVAPYITVSVGAATYGFDGETPRELLLAADRALYLAKQTGRNRVVAAGLRFPTAHVLQKAS